jgi:hypothetical protein
MGAKYPVSTWTNQKLFLAMWNLRGCFLEKRTDRDTDASRLNSPEERNGFVVSMPADTLGLTVSLEYGIHVARIPNISLWLTPGTLKPEIRVSKPPVHGSAFIGRRITHRQIIIINLRFIGFIPIPASAYGNTSRRSFSTARPALS